MKKYIIVLASLMCMVSCYKDLSTPANGVYSDIEWELSNNEDVIYIGYGSTLDLSVEASQEGFADEDLEYIWKMGTFVSSKYNELQEVSFDKNLSIQIVSTPSNDPYCVSLTVRNRHDGYSRNKVWRMYVNSTLGDGLLIAHTKDKGQSSILSLVTAKPLTYGYESDEYTVVDDVYGLANGGKKIKGKIHALLSRMTTYLDQPKPKSFGNYRVMVATEDTTRMLNPLQYKEEECNEALFQGNMLFSTFKADTLFNVATCSTCGIFDGYMYSCMEILDHCYTLAVVPFTPKNIFTPQNTSAVISSQGYVCVLNPNDKCFYACHGVFIAQSAFAKVEQPLAPSPEFMADKEAVAAGTTEGNKNGFILKDSQGKYYYLKMYLNENVAAQVVELDLPEVEKAKAFSFCDNSALFYYHTGDTIYATTITGSTASTRKVLFTPENSEEKITMVKQYTQAWWGAGQSSVGSPDELYYYAFPIETNRTQIIVVTYNETTGEGKFYLKPFNVSTGMFSAFKDNGVYGGFGEITSLCSTLK